MKGKKLKDIYREETKRSILFYIDKEMNYYCDTNYVLWLEKYINKMRCDNCGSINHSGLEFQCCDCKTYN